MPHRRKDKKHKKAAEESGPADEDRIGALRDALLRHVLSFLPSHEALPTCTLSRRWRDLWKSVPVLRIADVEEWKSAEDLNEFVNHLLLLRDRSPLDECEFNSYPYYSLRNYSDKPFRYVELWMRYALTCQARVPRVLVYTECERLVLVNVPIISRHLTLDFSCCPALEALKIRDCTILAREISSKSLRRLIITSSFFDRSPRTRISAPSLVSLCLNHCQGRAPLLQSMPLIVTALVRLDED